ncbi:hypothetical protein BUE80_DR009857 [Diplocarpon rosae]|nr:hypothetical protein BUE80_DR009857 [Diplocarpon rosae]
MKLTLPTAITLISLLSHVSMAQRDYTVECSMSLFANGIPDQATAKQAATNICQNGLNCKGRGRAALLTDAAKFRVVCSECPNNLARGTFGGCTTTPGVKSGTVFGK